MPYIESKQNDNLDPMRVQLKDGDGTPVVLTSVTAPDIAWKFTSLSDNQQATVTTGTIVDATAGRIQLDANLFPLSFVGRFEIQITVTFPGSRDKTYPLKDKFIWAVIPF